MRFLFDLCRLACWLGRHTRHFTARTWDIVCGLSIAVIAAALALLVLVMLWRKQEA